jgi:putative transposase
MPQSLARIYAHIVFSTKHRAEFLRDRDLREKMHAYLAVACRNMNSPTVIAGGASDHIHILCMLSRSHSV